MKDKKYFHEISDKEFDKLVREKKTWQYVIKNYLAPEWCKYPDPLCGSMGCWSLVYRGLVSNNYCKTCEYYEELTTQEKN